MTTRHWRTGCSRNASCCTGKKCRGIRWLLYQCTWLEKHFRATETFGAINDDVFVWEVEGHESPSHCLSSVPTCTGTKPSGSPCTWRTSKRRTGGFSLRQAERERRHTYAQEARLVACHAGHVSGGTQERAGVMPSPRPYCHLVHRPHNQARRVGGHALGARHTAFSMISGKGVYRVRRRRFAEARPDSTIGGSIIRMVSIAPLSVSFSMLSI